MIFPSAVHESTAVLRCRVFSEPLRDCFKMSFLREDLPLKNVLFLFLRGGDSCNVKLAV